MALYKEKPDEPPKEVWLVNPVDRVVAVVETAPEVGMARNKNQGGWRFAKPEQIKAAKAEAAAQAKADKEKAAEEQAKADALVQLGMPKKLGGRKKVEE
jgi:hypothetical protein